jgi:hypothetical protein
MARAQALEKNHAWVSGVRLLIKHAVSAVPNN